MLQNFYQFALYCMDIICLWSYFMKQTKQLRNCMKSYLVQYLCFNVTYEIRTYEILYEMKLPQQEKIEFFICLFLSEI